MNRRLKARIVEQFGCQVDFAMAIGRDQSFISQVVRGRRRLKPEEAGRWAQVLHCEAQDLA